MPVERLIETGGDGLCRFAAMSPMPPSGVTRAAVLRDPELSSGTGQFSAIQAVAPSLTVEANPVNVRDAGEVERAVAL